MDEAWQSSGARSAKMPAMRRLLLFLWAVLEFFVVAVTLLPVFLVVAAWTRDRDPGRRARGRVMRFLGRFSSQISLIWDFSVRGTAPADVSREGPGGRGYVVVSNHVSMADIYLLSHLPFDMRFIAKEELFRLPFIGLLLRLGGDVPLKRKQGDSIRAAMSELRKTLASGMSVMIFPEGTRTRDGHLLPFKDGAFQLAIEAQAPVLPVYLEGTRTCIPADKLLLDEARATVTILEPVETAGMTADDVGRLRDLVRSRIAAAAGEDGVAPAGAAAR